MSHNHNKHTVRFHFWQNRYNHEMRENEAMEGFILSWEDREFPSFEHALDFTKMIESPLVKIFNEHGKLVYNSRQHNCHNEY